MAQGHCWNTVATMGTNDIVGTRDNVVQGHCFEPTVTLDTSVAFVIPFELE
jgi:hypothetical protein